MFAEKREQFIRKIGKNKWIAKIEDVWPGDVVENIGEVVEILERKYANYVRLIIKGGAVVDGYYGKAVWLSKLSTLEYYSK
jgi:hypothetical protein